MAERRDAARFLVDHGLSERRACAMLDLHRSTFQYQAGPERSAELTEQGQELAQRQARYGYRRVWALRRRRGQHVNKQRIHRLWKQATLQVRTGKRTRRAAGTPSVPLHATQPGWKPFPVGAHLRTDDLGGSAVDPRNGS